jgi:hypothetical protein
MLRTANLQQIFSGNPESANTSVTEESKKFSVRKQKCLRQEQRRDQMNKSMVDMNGEIMVERMRNLRVGQQDLMNVADLKLEILERLAQVVGHFYKYDETTDSNILVKEGVFLCVDKVKRP